MLITNFAAGELSPTLNGRVDLQQYYSGVSRLENFEVIPTGGIKRRTGSKRLLKLNSDFRIIPFIIDGSNIFILALKAGQIQVYKITDGVSAEFKQSITVTYTSLDEVNAVQYAQTYDTLFLVHRNHKPIQLVFENNTIVKYEFTPNFYPDTVLSDPDDQVMLVKSTALEPNVSQTIDGKVQCQYTDINNVSRTRVYPRGTTVYYLKNGQLYKYPYGGSYWERTLSDTIDASLFTTEHNYPGCVSFFNNRLIFASTDNKQQKLWASMAPDTDETRYNKFTTYKKYVTVGKVVKDADLYTFTGDIPLPDMPNTYEITNISINVSGMSITDGSWFVSGDLFPVGAKVTGTIVNSSGTTTGLIVKSSGLTVEQTGTISNAVLNVSHWKDPSNVSAEDYEYQLTEQNVTTADCSFNFELASDQNDAIKFVSSNRFLAIATESTFWAMAAGCTALNIQVENQGRYGSSDIQGLSIAQATVYFAQGKKGIREFYYDNESQAFQTNNIAIHAQHLLQESPIFDFDYFNNPYNRLILTREDGTVATLLYDKTNGIMAWNRMTRSSGAYRSVAVTRGHNESDYIFFIVKQPKSDGTNEYYLEMIGDEKEVYLDSWQTYSTTVAVDYDDTAILWNKTKNKTCPKTSIPDDFAEATDEVYIGYKYRSYIKSMPCIANDPNGKKRITNLIVRFLESYMPTLKVTGVADEHFTTIVNLPYSGVANITYPGQTNRDVYFELEAEDEKPVTILAVNALLA